MYNWVLKEKNTLQTDRTHTPVTVERFYSVVYKGGSYNRLPQTYTNYHKGRIYKLS